jgi:hypothetical protein
MGILKSIKKGAKKIFKGIKKKFMKGLAFVGKIAGSKWGKILLLASSIFTGGMALVAGFQSFAATGGGFLAKFVAGAKGFMAGLAKPMAQAKSMLGGGAQTAGQLSQTVAAATAAQAPVQALQGVTQAGQIVGTGIPGAAQALQAATSGIAKTAATTATTAAQVGGGVGGKALQALQGVTTAAEEGNWLTKAAKIAKGIYESPTTKELLGGVVKGVGEGMKLKEEQKFEDRFRKAWEDPNNPFALLTQAAGYGEQTVAPGTPQFGPQSEIFRQQYQNQPAGGGA